MSTFTFVRLTADGLDEAVALCDECVGKHLYPRALLAAALDNPNHYFYLLVTPERETAGYIYFFLTDLSAMAALSKLPQSQLAVISKKQSPVVGSMQSIGVTAAFRSQGLSKQLVGFCLERLQALQADVAFAVLWKASDTAPMEPTMKQFQFRYLSDAHHVWYDNLDLICPYCKGRCECNAAIYYKPLGKEAIR